MKTAIRATLWLAAVFGPTLAFIIFTKPIKHPYPQPVPPSDGSIPVSKELP